MFTPYRELDALLADFVGTVRGILGDTFVGAYLQGSFALGAGDLHSDCDFIVATTVLPSGAAEAELRRLHDAIPTRPGHWTKHLEGSYADTTSLRGAPGLGVRWLFCDHGHRELTWDTHCNSLHTRWILRNHGITVAGPPISGLVDEVPPQPMREAMRTMLPGLMDGLRTWARFDMAWAQRYAVTAYCRALFTLHTGEVASKRGALEWARAHLDPMWHLLLDQVIEDRNRGFDPADPPRPGSIDAMHAFAAYAVCHGHADGSPGSWSEPEEPGRTSPQGERR
ncbi:aminoglycoside adenylyltransferase domain-containing protein [Streptomyces regalis]|uniref:aminoglycoside adenylyltransferase domain-containing protein n=1 Tax=Streptomyces regalis TaxID=68262 RepID=UPI0007C73F06|nr:aminoglycoside adenylyltransferase domain-containing protein [Streptomyces regalis]